MILNPNNVLVPAYRPIKFEASNTDLLATIEPCRAVVTIDGSIVATIYKDYDTASSIFFGFANFLYSIDIQTFVQEALAPFTKKLPTVFAPIGGGLQVDNIDCYATASILVQYRHRDLISNFAVDFGASEFSNDVYALPATLEHEDIMDLQAYYVGGIGLGTPFKVLTKQPKSHITICENESYNLSYIAEYTNAYQVSYYNSAGTLLWQNVKTWPVLGGLHMTIGVGPENLKNTIFAGGGLPTALWASVARYEIVVGFTNAGSFTPKSEVLNFVMDGCCCQDNTIRLFWFNSLSGCDQFTFACKKVWSHEVENDLAEAALSWVVNSPAPHNYSDEGTFILDKSINQKLAIESQPLTAELASWLRELPSSPKVYILDSKNDYIPVIISNYKQDYYDSDQALIKVKFELTMANEDIAQHN